MIRGCFLVVVLMTVTLQVQAAEARNRLTEFLSGLVTLQADFEQTVATESGRQARSSGTFYLSRPGRFRWRYAEPEGQLVVADGSRVWLYDAELEQVSHQSQVDALRGTPALLLSSTGPIEDQFEVVGVGSRIGLDWVELIPLANDGEINKVLIGFDGLRLDRLEMIDGFGQVSRFRFSNIQRNPTLDPGLFVFEPPPSVDILGQ